MDVVQSSVFDHQSVLLTVVLDMNLAPEMTISIPQFSWVDKGAYKGAVTESHTVLSSS